MLGLDGCAIQCPYCWEWQDITVDGTAGEQTYTEDCQVCCQPMVIQVHFDQQGEPQAEAISEDETF